MSTFEDILADHLPTLKVTMMTTPAPGSARHCSCGFRAEVFYAHVNDSADIANLITRQLADHVREELEKAGIGVMKDAVNDVLNELAKEAKQRGDIGKEGQLEVWDWLVWQTGLDISGSVTEDKQVLARLYSFVIGEQIARHDYHAPITAGQIGNILMGRNANNDGPEPKTKEP